MSFQQNLPVLNPTQTFVRFPHQMIKSVQFFLKFKVNKIRKSERVKKAQENP
jgi:hypothetical protein